MADAAHLRSIERLRSAVKASVAALPAEEAARLHAVLLFGSRARGTHHPRSDWDLCAVWEGAPPAQRGGWAPSVHEGRDVDRIDVQVVDFARRSGHVGTAQRLARLQGVPLLGTVEDIPFREEAVPMNHETWAQHLRRMTLKARLALGGIRDMIRSPEVTSGDLVTGSADFAEFVVKLALDLRGIDPEQVHQLEVLQEQWPAGEPWRRRIEKLNGRTETDHGDSYIPEPKRQTAPKEEEDNARCMARFVETMRFLRDALRDPRLGGAFAQRSPAVAPLDDKRASRDQWRATFDTAHAAARMWNEDVVDGLRRLRHEEGFAGALLDEMVDAAVSVSRWAGEREREMDAALKRDGASRRPMPRT